MAIRITLFFLIMLGFAGIGATTMLRPQPATVAAPPAELAAAAPAPQTQILVAARVIRGGTLLLPDDVTSKPVPPGAVPDGAWVDSLDTRAATQGAMVRHHIEPGEPILRDDIVRPGERGFLAAVLKPGARAATIGVDAVSGTAGLIWPGDRVDVILTQKLDDTTTPASRRVVGETVLSNVRVIAVDRHMTEGVAPQDGLASITATARTVTVEVEPQEAEKLAVANTLGHLGLVVRSATEPAPPPGADAAATAAPAAGDTTAVWSSDVSAAYRGAPGSPDATVHLFTGSQTKPVEYHF